MSYKIETKAGEAQAENGVVIVDGPDPVAISMTPKAAAKMGKRMIEAAQVADAHPEFQEERRRP